MKVTKEQKVMKIGDNGGIGIKNGLLWYWWWEPCKSGAKSILCHYQIYKVCHFLLFPCEESVQHSAESLPGLPNMRANGLIDDPGSLLGVLQGWWLALLGPAVLIFQKFSLGGQLCQFRCFLFSRNSDVFFAICFFSFLFFRSGDVACLQHF